MYKHMYSVLQGTRGQPKLIFGRRDSQLAVVQLGATYVYIYICIYIYIYMTIYAIYAYICLYIYIYMTIYDYI